jgi:hypothetical protein
MLRLFRSDIAKIFQRLHRQDEDKAAINQAVDRQTEDIWKAYERLTEQEERMTKTSDMAKICYEYLNEVQLEVKKHSVVYARKLQESTDLIDLATLNLKTLGKKVDAIAEFIQGREEGVKPKLTIQPSPPVKTWDTVEEWASGVSQFLEESTKDWGAATYLQSWQYSTKNGEDGGI